MLPKDLKVRKSKNKIALAALEDLRAKIMSISREKFNEGAKVLFEDFDGHTALALEKKIKDAMVVTWLSMGFAVGLFVYEKRTGMHGYFAVPTFIFLASIAIFFIQRSRLAVMEKYKEERTEQYVDNIWNKHQETGIDLEQCAQAYREMKINPRARL